MRFSLLASLGLLTLAVAVPTKRHVVHEKRDRLPSNWEKRSDLAADSILPLRIGLTQSNLDKAHEYLMDVSHPSSSNYGSHWSPKKVAETFAPSDDSVKSVIQWLSENGIEEGRVRQSQSLTWLHVNVTVAEAEALLKTKYTVYAHSVSEQLHVACEDYSIPHDIQQHIDLITPTVHFDTKISSPKKRLDANEKKVKSKRAAMHKRQSTSTHGHVVAEGAAKSVGGPTDGNLPKLGTQVSDASMVKLSLATCNEAITPDCLRALYEIPTDLVANPDNSYGIVEYSPQAYIPSDLDLFFRNFSPALVGTYPIFDSIDGGVLQTEVESFGYNGESDLDLEYSMALVYPQNVTLYQTGDLAEGASFNNFLDALDGAYCTSDGGDDPEQDGVYPDPYGSGYGYYSGPENCGGFAAAKTISTSYGYNEADLTPFYETRQCNEYLKLGLQGVSFFYSSGDYGVAGNDGQCIDPTTGEYTDGTYGTFNPAFPSSCPYITSVGATQVKANATVTQPESAAESVIYSGGGFSNVFSMPDYQASAVASYFASYKPAYNSSLYNSSQTTRGFPDVAANGVNYVIALDGEFDYIYGTSASSPTFGSVITLINGLRLDAGKSPVGFINPVIYENAQAFNDIQEGGNEGCGTAGFTAVPGWDPVTGLGTPNFPALRDVWLALP